MVLDKEIKTQLAQYLNLLESDIVLQTDLGVLVLHKKGKKVVLFSQAYQWATNSHLSF